MKNKYLYGIGMILTFLIVSMPFCFAAEMSLTYDANGNLVTGDGKYRTYNSLNQLWRVYNGSNSSGILLEEYMYHPVEERVWTKKTYNTTGTLIETVYYVNQNRIIITNLTGTFNYTYVYHEGQLVAQINPDGSKYFIHSDSKGSNTVITNSSGKIIENSSYSPFGEILTSGNNSRYGYEGKEYDSKIGDMDFNARKYNPSTGLFSSPDTLIQNVYDPQSLNRYTFERGNPYKTVDPTGHGDDSVNQEDAEQVIESFINMEEKVGNNNEAQDISDYQYVQLYDEWCSTYVCEKQNTNDNPTYAFQGVYTAAGFEYGDVLKDSSQARKMDAAKLELWSRLKNTNPQITGSTPTQKAPDIDTVLSQQVNLIIQQGKSDTLPTWAIALYVKNSPNYRETVHDLNKNSGCTSVYNEKRGGYDYKC